MYFQYSQFSGNSNVLRQNFPSVMFPTYTLAHRADGLCPQIFLGAEGRHFLWNILNLIYTELHFLRIFVNSRGL